MVAERFTSKICLSGSETNVEFVRCLIFQFMSRLSFVRKAHIELRR